MGTTARPTSSTGGGRAVTKPNAERARVNVDLGWVLRRLLPELRDAVRAKHGAAVPLSDSEVIRYALLALACELLPTTTVAGLLDQRLSVPGGAELIRAELDARRDDERPPPPKG